MESIHSRFAERELEGMLNTARWQSEAAPPAFLAQIIAKLDRVTDSVVHAKGTLGALEARVFGPSLAGGGEGTAQNKRDSPSEEEQINSRLETLIGLAMMTDETASRLASRL